MAIEDRVDMNFDEIYRKIGSYGRYQVKIMIQIFLNNLPVGFNIMALIFQIHDIPFSCRSLPNNSFEEIASNSTVYYESCFVKIPLNETSKETDKNKTIPCPNGYQYEYERHASIRSEWDLVCGDEAFADLLYTIYSIGKLVGCFVLPSVADRYGRKPLIILSNFGMGFLNTIIIFSPSYTFFAVIKGLTGFFEPGLSIPGFVLLLELFPAECRTYTQLFHGIAWGFVLMLLCPVAYLAEPYGWRCLNAVMALVSCGFLFHIWTLDESLRWLVQTGKLKRANATIKRMCQVNKVNYSEIDSLVTQLDGVNFVKDIELRHSNEIYSTELRHSNGIHSTELRHSNGIHSTELRHSNGIHSTEQHLDGIHSTEQHLDGIHSTEQHLDPVPSEAKEELLKETHLNDKYGKLPGIIVIFIIPCLRKMILIMFYLFFVCSLTYYGLYLMTTRLSGNRFLNFFISALFEMLSQVLSIMVFTRFSRKTCCMGCLTFTSLVLITAVLLRTLTTNDIAVMASTGFSFLGTFGISASFLLVSIYVGELFPTDVRNVGAALATIASRIGQIIAPFAKYLSRLLPWGPGIIFGVLCLLTNILIRYLPETLNKQLPQTIEDVKIRNREEIKEKISKKQMKK